MITFYLDFNDQTEDGEVVGLISRATGPREPRVGDNVFLRDAEGNRARGHVVRLVGAVAYVAPEWHTWVPAESVIQGMTLAHEVAFTADVVALPASYSSAVESRTKREPEPEPV